MDCQSMPSTPEGSSIPQCYGYAQKLNNNAAFSIECGQYQRAEASLTKALVLSKAYAAEKMLGKVCRCYSCSLDGCIIHTEDSHTAIQAGTSGKDSLANSSNTPENRTNSCISASYNDESSVYQRPIRVPCLPISEGHYMDRVFSIIIVFNLGLSTYLRAVEGGDSDNLNNGTRRRMLLEKSLQLYEVAYKFLKERIIDGESSIGVKWDPIYNDTGAQFRIILCNNLYHIHEQANLCSPKSSVERYSNLTKKHQEYLQELLSLLVFLLERSSLQTSPHDGSNNNRDHQPRRVINFEKFWKTVDRLVLKALCADAA